MSKILNLPPVNAYFEYLNAFSQLIDMLVFIAATCNASPAMRIDAITVFSNQQFRAKYCNVWAAFYQPMVFPILIVMLIGTA
jgi:hypothetical protein